MRFALVFLLCVAPLAWGIRMLGQDEPKASGLSEQLAIENGEAVLVASDLLDERGESPFQGEILELKDIVVKLVEDGRVESYVAVRRLDRHEGMPRLVGVRCALFETEKGKQEDLRATIEAPYIAGDPAQWLRGEEEGQRFVELGGGVVVRDAQGRQLVRIPNLRVDLKTKRIRSEARIEAGDPERGIEISGVGLEGDVVERRVTLLHDIVARIPYADEVLRIRCAGPATLTRHDGEGDEPDRIELVVENGIEFDHPLLDARCERIEATLITPAEGDARLVSALLTGPIRADFDPGVARGLEWIETDSLRIEGEERIVVEGPYRGAARGALPSVSGATEGLGERKFEISGGSAWFALRRTTKAERRESKMGVELVAAHFERSLEVNEPGGVARFKAGELHLEIKTQSFDARGGVEARSPEGSMRTDSVSGKSKGKGHLKLDFTGATELTYLYVGKGRLGPLARAPEGRIELRCSRTLSVEAGRDRQEVAATGAVEAELDDDVSLKCEQFALVARKAEEGKEVQAIESFSATGGVRITDRSLGSDVAGDSIIRREGTTALIGKPALVKAGPNRSVSARKLSYDDDGDFEASGTVRIVSPLDEKAGAETWTIVCDRAEGHMPEEGPPTRVTAHGPIFAEGPDGLRIEGSLFEFEAKTSKAVLTGNPARFRHGTDLDLDADGFEIEVDLEKGVARSAWTRGKSRIQVNPKGEGKLVAGLADLDFHRIHVQLAGPAHYDGTSLKVAKGGILAAFDEQGTVLLEAEVGAILVELGPIEGERVTAKRVLGSGGVTVSSRGIRATADTLSYAPGSGLVNVEGNARATGAGIDAEVTWQRLTFIRVKDGIDLKSVRAIKLTPKPKESPED